jgi:hypothetical protein
LRTSESIVVEGAIVACCRGSRVDRRPSQAAALSGRDGVVTVILNSRRSSGLCLDYSSLAILASRTYRFLVGRRSPVTPPSSMAPLIRIQTSLTLEHPGSQTLIVPAALELRPAWNVELRPAWNLDSRPVWNVESRPAWNVDSRLPWNVGSNEPRVAFHLSSEPSRGSRAIWCERRQSS